MKLNKTKFDAMRKEKEKERDEKIALLGESLPVVAGHEHRDITCGKHGVYQTRLVPDGPQEIIKTFRGEAPSKYREHTYCPTCKKELDDQCAAQLAEIDAMERAEREEGRFRHLIDESGVSARQAYVQLREIAPVNQKQEQAVAIANTIIENLKSGEQAPNMIMSGSVGTGKTLIAAAAVQSAIRSGLTAKINTVMGVIRAFRAAWKRDCEYSETDIIRELTTVDILVLDEVGVQYGSDSEKLFVFDVIDGRYRNMKPTILISNLNIDGIRECIGDRCVDRMREDGGKVVAFDFESQRGKR